MLPPNTGTLLAHRVPMSDLHCRQLYLFAIETLNVFLFFSALLNGSCSPIVHSVIIPLFSLLAKVGVFFFFCIVVPCILFLNYFFCCFLGSVSQFVAVSPFSSVLILCNFPAEVD